MDRLYTDWVRSSFLVHAALRVSSIQRDYRDGNFFRADQLADRLRIVARSFRPPCPNLEIFQFYWLNGRIVRRVRPVDISKANQHIDWNGDTEEFNSGPLALDPIDSISINWLSSFSPREIEDGDAFKYPTERKNQLCNRFQNQRSSMFAWNHNAYWSFQLGEW